MKFPNSYEDTDDLDRNDLPKIKFNPKGSGQKFIRKIIKRALNGKNLMADLMAERESLAKEVPESLIRVSELEVLLFELYNGMNAEMDFKEKPSEAFIKIIKMVRGVLKL